MLSSVGKLSTRYTFKDNECIALSARSAQSIHVHRSWPKMLCNQISRLTKCPNERIQIQQQLKNRLMSSYTPILWPAESRKPKEKKENDRNETLWFPVVHHPRLRSSLEKFVQTMNQDCNELFSGFEQHIKRKYVRIGIAWKNPSGRMEYKVR